MTEEEIIAKEAELREKYPECFDHPETKEGEILLEMAIADIVSINMHIYKSKGLTSVRKGKMVLKPFDGKINGEPPDPNKKFAHYPIFANLHQCILWEEAEKQKADATNPA